MSQITVEVAIDHGKIIPLQPERLPSVGRGFITFEWPDDELPPGGDFEALPPGIRQARRAGLDAGKITMADDFNAPLPDSFWGLESAR